MLDKVRRVRDIKGLQLVADSLNLITIVSGENAIMLQFLILIVLLKSKNRSSLYGLRTDHILNSIRSPVSGTSMSR